MAHGGEDAQGARPKICGQHALATGPSHARPIVEKYYEAGDHQFNSQLPQGMYLLYTQVDKIMRRTLDNIPQKTII